MLRSAVAEPSVTLDDPSGFLHDPIGYLVKLYHRHGRAVTPAPGRDDFVFALGPDHNQAIYQQPDLFVATGFLFPGPRNSAQRRLLAGLFNLNGERHRDHRRLMMPTFQKQTALDYHDAVVAECEEFLAGWRAGEVRDVSAEMLALVTRLNCRLLLGVRGVRPGARAGSRHGRVDGTEHAPDRGRVAVPGPHPFVVRRSPGQLRAGWRS